MAAADVVITSGPTVAATLSLGGTSQSLAPPVASPPARTGVAAGAPAPSDPTKWFTVQRTFGPVHLARVGVQYRDSVLWFLLDAALSALGLTLSLDGLGAGSPITRFEPRFTLRGLGVDYKNPAIEIGAAFLHVTVTDAQGRTYDEYDGAAIVKAQGLTLSAIGSYAYLDGHPSLFVYAVLDYPIGGPAGSSSSPALPQCSGTTAPSSFRRSTRSRSSRLVSEAVKGAVPRPADGPPPPSPAERVSTELARLRDYLPPSAGDNFLAVGIRFSSFTMLDLFALLMVSFGHRVEDPTAPRPVHPGRADADPRPGGRAAAGRDPDGGEGELRPRRGIPGCRRAAHPCLVRPVPRLPSHRRLRLLRVVLRRAPRRLRPQPRRLPPGVRPAVHYPIVPRLGIACRARPAVTGEAYFALIPAAFMAGVMIGRRSTPALKAWFHAGVDFIVGWEPFHYDAHAFATLRASYRFELFGTREIRIDASADLHLRGPEFSGRASIRCPRLVEFDVTFGAAALAAPDPIGWVEFKASFLPKAGADGVIPCCSVAVTDGLVRKSDTGGADGIDLGIVNPKTFALAANSVIPSTSAVTGKPVDVAALVAERRGRGADGRRTGAADLRPGHPHLPQREGRGGPLQLHPGRQAGACGAVGSLGPARRQRGPPRRAGALGIHHPAEGRRRARHGHHVAARRLAVLRRPDDADVHMGEPTRRTAQRTDGRGGHRPVDDHGAGTDGGTGAPAGRSRNHRACRRGRLDRRRAQHRVRDTDMTETTIAGAPATRVTFIEYHRPAMPPGGYTVEVSQAVTAPGGVAETFLSRRRFTVAGDRLTLHAGDAYAVFPPEGSLGDHSDVLPHVLLGRSTMPWEFAADDTGTPWLVLLLFDEQESLGGTLTHAAFLRDYSGADAAAVWEHLLDERVGWLRKLDAPPDTALVVARASRAAADLGDPFTPDTAAVEAVLDRYRTPQVMTVADLRSASTGPVRWPGLPAAAGDHDDTDQVTVIDVEKRLLATVLPSAADLRLLTHVRRAQDADGQLIDDERAVVLGSRLPQRNGVSVAHLVSVGGRYIDGRFDLRDAADDDYIRLVCLKSWRFACLDPAGDFTGLLSNLDRTPSGLRLPALPDAEAERHLSGGLRPAAAPVQAVGGDRVVVPRADAALCVTPRHPAARADRGEPPALRPCARHVRRLVRGRVGAGPPAGRAEQAAVDLAVQLEAGPRAGGAAGPVLDPASGVDAAGRGPASPDVVSWFEQLRLLRGVPFRYLVPDDRLLPAESIRFFQLDQVWADCLVDGAFSIGRITGTLKGVDHEQKTALLETLTVHPTVTGLLMRSSVVAGWPGLLVDAYGQAPEGAVRGPQLDVARMERLAPDLLLCLFSGAAARVELHQKPETLHFGTAHLTGDWKNAARVVNVGVLATSLQSDPPLTSADLAAKVVAGVPRVTYVLGSRWPRRGRCRGSRRDGKVSALRGAVAVTVDDPPFAVLAAEHVGGAQRVRRPPTARSSRRSCARTRRCRRGRRMLRPRSAPVSRPPVGEMAGHPALDAAHLLGAARRSGGTEQADRVLGGPDGRPGLDIAAAERPVRPLPARERLCEEVIDLCHDELRYNRGVFNTKRMHRIG